ncbi:MAG: glycosyltransferase family 4 protein [Proteobacteria bacterium]|nr:glycosyltransferase family 4 protein [Pseudomonadota bacterium]
MGNLKIALYNLTTTIKTGGVETVYWAVAREFCRLGFQVVVMGGEGEVEAPFEAENLEVRCYPFKPRQDFLDLGTRYRKWRERMSFARQTRADLEKLGFDVILIGKPYDLGPALRGGHGVGARVAFMSGGLEFIPGYGRLVRRLDYFCAVSDYIARKIEDHCGVRPETNYNGVDVDRYQPRPPDEEMAARLGVGRDEKVIVTACRLIGWKGVAYGLEAAARLKAGRTYKYFIAGEGPESESLRKLARDLGVSDVVTFLGRLAPAELARLYSLADVGVFPSVADEAFGISCAEAMAAEVPVVTTNVGGIPEVLGDGAGGLLVGPRDAAALAEAVGRLLEDRDLARNLALKGRQRVIDNFTWPRWADQFLRGIGEA